MQSKDSLLRKVFNAQVKMPSKGDWTSEVRNILKELKINKTFEEIESISKTSLATNVKLAIKQHAFEYLIAIQKQKQKGKKIIYTHLNLQPYFRSIENLNITSQRKLFALRTQMNHIKANFCSSSEIQKCEIRSSEMDNYHLFKCTRRNNIDNITYDHILNGNILEQKNALKYMKENEI